MEAFRAILSFTTDEMFAERLEDDYFEGDLLVDPHDNKVVFITSEEETILLEDCETIITTNEYIEITNNAGRWNFDLIEREV